MVEGQEAVVMGVGWEAMVMEMGWVGAVMGAGQGRMALEMVSLGFGKPQTLHPLSFAVGPSRLHKASPVSAE